MERSTSKKVRAILAGGLVLGVGAAVVLAAWNDSEFATGTFAAGDFGIQGSLDGTAFSEHDGTAGNDPAALAFAVDADNLAPEQPVYAAFAVRLDPGSTNAASVSIEASSAATIADHLTYSLVTTGADVGCDAAVFAGGTALVSDAATTTSSAPAIFALPALATVVNLCFEVTAGTTLPPGAATGSVSWDLAAASTTTLP
jgi:predicted ribosomally synthesized peptide with SipW-like signal peptide